MVKITFENNVTKANADTFNTMQDNIEDAINNVSINLDDEVSTSSTNGVENQAITNYVDGEISDLKDYVDGTIISSSDYIKLPDGTLIVYGTSDTITFTAQSSSYDTINFPVSFKDTNYAVNITINSSFSFFTYIYLNPSDRAVDSVKIGGFNEHTSSISGQLDYIIIGRWK